MYKEMINLFADKSVSSLYVDAYIQAMAREQGAGVYVWHGEQEDFSAAANRLADTLELSKAYRLASSDRKVYVYGLDPSGCDGLSRIRKKDQTIDILMLSISVPPAHLMKLKAALSYCCSEDISALLSGKMSSRNDGSVSFTAEIPNEFENYEDG